MPIRRVALIFDDRLRPDTTGVYVRRALAERVDVVHFPPGSAEAIPRTGFDLYLSVDDDTEHRLPSDLHPRAYWAIDTHRDLAARLRRSADSELVFAAQRDGAERLRAAGIDSATWLPLACDPAVHRKHDVVKEYDVAFVRHVFPGPREELLGMIAREFPAHFIGRAFFDEMARTYSASRVVFNRSLGNDINMRVFEALACGSLLVTNDLAENGQEELLGDRVHLAAYRESEELIEIIAYYLAHPEEREAIAAAGRAEAVGRHTYRHPMERLLAEAERRTGRAVVAVGGRGPTQAAGRPDAGGSGAGPGTIDSIGPPRWALPTLRRGLASIIVPRFNQRAFTQLCLQALFHFTRPGSWELIVVDNGSTDETAAYLAGVQDATAVPVTVITNPCNLGFPAAVNQGLQVAAGEHLVLLNNDAVVTEGWLDHLVALTSAPIGPEGAGAAGIGLVGPMSNYATPPQLVDDVSYRDVDEMHAFAGRWRDEHRGQWLVAGKLSGFCLLLTRAVYRAIGGLDERFGPGFFDDDDLAVRARRAGFASAVATDVFVHHFGSRTFTGSGIDAAGLLTENARKFAEKWGDQVAPGRPVALRSWAPEFHAETQRGAETQRRPGGGPGPSSGRAVRVSLTMIVWDEEENLPRCLASVRGVFDEIIVVDTGSVDRTREVASEHGAEVFAFAWIDDFAAARNASLGRATGDYAFWLDADDVIEPDQRGRLAALLDGLLAGEEVAYVVRCACDPGADGSGVETVVDHIRLFPLRPDVRWTYRVHEQILPALRMADIPVRWTDLVVRHTGYIDVALRARKLDRDARILLEELWDRPEEPFILFNLRAIAIERKDWRGALEYLGRSLAHSAPSDSITRKLFALIARAHQMLGDSEAALRACAEGLRFDPEDAELLFRAAVIHRHRGEPEEAGCRWRRILELKRPERFASVVMGIYGHLTRRNLAALAAERGDREDEERLWRAVLAECPGDREALARLEGPRAGRLDSRRVDAVGVADRSTAAVGTGEDSGDPWRR
jgi:glycosyltransferase involved in cell wall biosynthesis